MMGGSHHTRRPENFKQGSSSGPKEVGSTAHQKTIDAECSTSMAKQNNREKLAGKAGGGRDNAPASAQRMPNENPED
jgi:hypothetical protein